MGFKRPFDEENCEESSIRHLKHQDCGNKLTSFEEDFTLYGAYEKAEMPDLASDEIDSASSSWVTSTTSEEDAGSEIAFCSSLSPDHSEFNFSRQRCIQLEDTYSYVLYSSPRKEVPLGPNHQADIPIWDPELIEKRTLGSNIVDARDNDKYIGTCVIPMPGSKLSACDGCKDVDRLGCACLDEGSVRCMQQHVKEARVNLRKALGHKVFVELGFLEMGEEVAHKWTEEEEEVFHEVVYSHPASLGEKFWEHLQVTLPSRTMRELVSYYFNVFMLRTRAIQNRSQSLEIDSDDDEWHENEGESFVVQVEEEDTALGSFADEDLDENDKEDDDDKDVGDDDVFDAGDGGDGAFEKDSVRGLSEETQIEASVADDNHDFMVYPVGKISGRFHGYFNFQDNSCMSYEGQPYVLDSCGPLNMTASPKEGDCGIFLEEKSNDLVPKYVLDSVDSKIWDAGDVDLLPTCLVIEEIIGQCSESTEDESIY